MSVEINDAEKNRGVEFTKGNGINEFNEPIDSKYKTQQKSAFNANDVAMNIAKKTDAKKQEVQEFKQKTQIKQDQDSVHEDRSNFEQSPQGLKKKGLVGILGDIAKGVLGSSKKQQDELRRLEVEVKALDKDNERLDSLLNNTSLDSISAQFESTIIVNDDDDVQDLDGQNLAAKENELIDQSARNNMKKSDKLDRISQLRKKGVK